MQTNNFTLQPVNKVIANNPKNVPNMPKSDLSNRQAA